MTGSDGSRHQPVVIFGTGLLASLVHHVLVHDAGRRVVAFTVDRAWATATRFEDRPVCPFDTLGEQWSPDDVEVLICIGWHRINGVRRDRFDEVRRRGYRFARHVSRRAVVWPDLEIRDNTIIFEGAIVQSHARIGENVILRSGANIGHHATVGSHTFIAPSAVTGGGVAIGEQVFVGVGAVLRDRIRVADRTLIGAGAAVLRDTEPDGVYAGNPARRMAKSALEATAVAG